ncbi:3066_t:CDS:2 [Rhizophagus irregularis]|nr:3066_t:CDS:2 [Rhizophagus irregularis]
MSTKGDQINCQCGDSCQCTGVCTCGKSSTTTTKATETKDSKSGETHKAYLVLAANASVLQEHVTAVRNDLNDFIKYPMMHLL